MLICGAKKGESSEHVYSIYNLELIVTNGAVGVDISTQEDAKLGQLSLSLQLPSQKARDMFVERLHEMVGEAQKELGKCILK